jgi:hypothetical protein
MTKTLRVHLMIAREKHLIACNFQTTPKTTADYFG